MFSKMSPARISQYRVLASEVKKAQERLLNFKEECLVEAPAQVGDRVEITGYSYRGKQMEVTRIALAEQYGKLSWWAIGRVIKGDGSPGQQQGETFWEIQE